MLLNITLLQGFLFRGTESGGVQKRDGTDREKGTRLQRWADTGSTGTGRPLEIMKL